ncbi:MAG: hypothetical protein CVT49_15875 [candidate division Zixibacteria bacterium HGW-Zixibacteria-1]|nr:MAG: hypothetical protein CVT49_15875 [candidate division Zixibacteria bacterium HGW-Zixibacteria-1]
MLNGEHYTCHIPDEAKWLFYAGKVCAAAVAEIAAENQASILVLMDNDTIVLSEPSDFELASDQCLAYCPVMHNRSGSLFEAPPDDFWSRIYRVLSISDDMLFPMVTPADNQKIRAYFHIGLVVARPERGVLRRLANDFGLLYRDPVLADMCRNDRDKKVFLHQTALVGALHIVARNEMIELPGRYNYPVFFEKRYKSEAVFNSIENVIILRCVISEKDAGPDWDRRLTGPPEKLAWLKERLFLK